MVVHEAHALAVVALRFMVAKGGVAVMARSVMMACRVVMMGRGAMMMARGGVVMMARRVMVVRDVMVVMMAGVRVGRAGERRGDGERDRHESLLQGLSPRARTVAAARAGAQAGTARPMAGVRPGRLKVRPAVAPP